MVIVFNILMAGYFVFLFASVRKIVMDQEQALESELARISQSLIDFQERKNVLLKEKSKLDEEAKNIYILYELTKEITKSTHEKEAQQIFNRMLHKHVQFDSCEMLDALSPQQDWQQQQDTFVFTLISKRRKMGYLVIKGCRESELEKVVILGNQYALALRRVKLYENIERIAITDGLTELYTRRYLEERLEEEIKRSVRRNIKLSFLMIDVDHFKKINDEHSHLTGDQVLHAIGEIIKQNIRGIDIAARYGGEEFSLILPDTDQKGAHYAAERIRHAVEESSIRAYDAELKVTVSIGVATCPKDGKKMDDIIDRADQALYLAKQKGRNCICVYGKDK